MPKQTVTKNTSRKRALYCFCLVLDFVVVVVATIKIYKNIYYAFKWT